jgi:NADPH:quinone reductase-like Zn-dependent oxidoreductase
MAKTVRFYEFGDASVLKLDDVPILEPKAGEIRIKVAAIGLNRAEVMFRRGKYLERAEKFPCGLGYEASGTVDAIGSGVTGFKIGDKVSTIPAFSMQRYGVYGEYAVVPAHAVSHHPDNLSFEEAASIWMQYLTAYGALIEYAKIKKGDFVLITAASSSVGLAAIQICRVTGAIPIATTRGESKKQFILNAGAHTVITTDTQNLVEEVNKLTNNQGVDYVFDPVAGEFLQVLAQATKSGGTIFEYGALSTNPTIFPLFDALKKGLKIQGYTLFEIVSDPEKYKRGQQYVIDLLSKSNVKPIIDKTFPLDKIVDAHRHMESNSQNGKIVVTV